jgi:hypothetical protein
MEVDLGISNDASKFVAQGVPFLFCLQNVNASLGFRGAADKYYKTFPEFYLSRANKVGCWTIYAPKNVFAWWEFGCAYNQMQLNPNGDSNVAEIVSDDQFGLSSIAYSEPQGYWAGYGQEGSGFTDADLTQTIMQAPFLADQNLPPDVLDTGLVTGIGRAYMCNAVLNSALEDENGIWRHIQWVTGRWGGYAGWTLLLMNPDPDLASPGRDDVSWLHEYLGVAALATSNNATLDGVYVDSVQDFAGIGVDNYRRAHWAAADIPLTFNDTTKQPVQMSGMALCEFVDFLRNEAQNRSWMILGNGWVGHYSYMAHLFDVLGASENNALNVGEGWMRALRFQAGKKPVSFLDYSLINESSLTEQQMQDSFDLMLLYDFMPGTADWYAATSTGIERARGYMRKYIPEFITLGEAGWEPLTGASSDNCKIERYGSFADENLTFAIRNTSGSAIKNEKIFISRATLGIGSTDSLKAVRLPDYTLSFVDQQTDQIRVGDLDSGETIVIRVGRTGHIDTFIRKRCDFYITYLENLKSTTTVQQLSNMIDITILRQGCSAVDFGLKPVVDNLLANVNTLSQSQDRDTAIFYLETMLSAIDLNADILCIIPSQDAEVKEEYPDSNFNSGQGVPGAGISIGKIDALGTLHRAYYMFDLSTLNGKKIISADFSIYHFGRGLNVKSTATNWDETSLTWNNQPGYWSSWEGNIGGWYQSAWNRQSIVLNQTAIDEIQAAIDSGCNKYSLVFYYEGSEPYPWAHADSWLKECQYSPDYKPELKLIFTGVADNTDEFQPSGDAEVRQESPDSNFNIGQGTPGAAVTIGKVDASGNIHRAYYMFDLSSLSGKEVIAANFNIYHFGRRLNVKSVVASWNEISLTWNNQPSSWGTWSGNIGSWHQAYWERRGISLPAESIAEIQDSINNGNGKYSLVLFYEDSEPYPWAHADSWLKESSFGDNYLPQLKLFTNNN